MADLEAVGDLIDDALNRGQQDAAAFRVMQFRLMLRQSQTSAADESTRLTARIWVALLNYMAYSDAEMRHAPNQGAYLTLGEIGMDAGGVALWNCCDSDDDSINGWPDGGADPVG